MKPGPEECAKLLIQLCFTSKRGEKANRVRVAELSLRRLWGRHQIDADFVQQVNEYLLDEGWVLFFTDVTYAAVRVSTVAAWARVSSKNLEGEREGDQA